MDIDTVKKSLLTYTPTVGRILLLSIITLFFGINVYQFFLNTRNQNPHLKRLLEQPLDPTVHISYAKHLFLNRDITRAQNELSIASKLNVNSNVLGAENASTQYQSWVNDKSREKNQTIHWLTTLTTYPNFPEAYVYLGLLSERQGSWVNANTYYEKAKLLDPLIDIDLIKKTTTNTQ